MSPSRPRFLLRAAIAIAAISLLSCGRFASQADAKFGDQHFKTAIALIELYHVRHGVYPRSLSELDFRGDWDQIALASVTYEPLTNGYALDATRGWIGQPSLSYPAGFWVGLGLRRTNVSHSGPTL
jgi:hypothetical protein